VSIPVTVLSGLVVCADDNDEEESGGAHDVAAGGTNEEQDKKRKRVISRFLSRIENNLFVDIRCETRMGETTRDIL